MNLILIQEVPNLGSLGDEVRVKDGYARNFLLPRGFAIVADSKKSGEIEHQKKRLEHLRLAAIEAAKTESEKVAGLELSIKAKAGANGKLFGSVTNRDIQGLLAEKGYTVDRRAIQLQVPIKSVGNYTATVRLHTDVRTSITVQVTPEFVSDGLQEEQTAEEGAVDAATEGGQEHQDGSTDSEASTPAMMAESSGDAVSEGTADTEPPEPAADGSEDEIKGE